MTTLFKGIGRSVFVALTLASGGILAQTGTTWRNSFPEPDATLRESLLLALFPGAQFIWSPELKVKVAGSEPRVVQFSGFNYLLGDDGNFNGVTGLDLGKAKEDYISRSRNFRQSDSKSFPASLIVFSAAQSGHILSFKKFTLDPLDMLASVKSVELTKWPMLRLGYESHFPTADSFTTIEWDALFDAKGGHFVSRRPRGIQRKLKNGEEQIHMFTMSRLSPSQIQITDVLSKQTVPYPCSDPCVIDGPTLLSQWPQ